MCCMRQRAADGAMRPATAASWREFFPTKP